jgi:hypothetical protein
VFQKRESENVPHICKDLFGVHTKRYKTTTGFVSGVCVWLKEERTIKEIKNEPKIFLLHDDTCFLVAFSCYIYTKLRRKYVLAERIL